MTGPLILVGSLVGIVAASNLPSPIDAGVLVMLVIVQCGSIAASR